MRNEKPICAKFMSKATQVPDLLRHMEEQEFALTAQYTCLKTANVVGPDNTVVDPESCQPTRRCFVEV